MRPAANGRQASIACERATHIWVLISLSADCLADRLPTEAGAPTRDGVVRFVRRRRRRLSFGGRLILRSTFSRTDAPHANRWLTGPLANPSGSVSALAQVSHSRPRVRASVKARAAALSLEIVCINLAPPGRIVRLWFAAGGNRDRHRHREGPHSLPTPPLPSGGENADKAAAFKALKLIISSSHSLAAHSPPAARPRRR